MLPLMVVQFIEAVQGELIDHKQEVNKLRLQLAMKMSQQHPKEKEMQQLQNDHQIMCV